MKCQQMKKVMAFIIGIFYTLLSITSGAGCGKTNTVNEYRPTSIHVSTATLNLVPGETYQLTANAIPAVANQPVFQWHAADTAVATVTKGLVMGIAPGETDIRVSYKGVQNIVKVIVASPPADEKSARLYERMLNSSQSIPELLTNGMGTYTAQGLNVTGKGNIVKLDKFYAIAERKVQYTVNFSADAKAIFRSSEGDFNAYVDLTQKKISIATSPETAMNVSFLQAGRDYLIEVYHVYQQARLRIVDLKTGQAAEVKAVHDGQGGAGKGVLQNGFSVGMQWDHYCFGLTAGTSMLVKKIAVYALKKKVNMLLYGDSITQPEGYFPTKDYPQAWTQQVISRMEGNAMSSGRGGARIDMVLDYIKNELPFIETKYVMVTIGTNGGNTEAKLLELINYIRSQGAIPVLNNIPSNESGTQVAENILIEKVRQQEGLKGTRFDLATSINGDGREVDKTTMYWEDYTGSYGWQIYHHPNEKGGRLMFERTLQDVPEIYQ
jgi:hypothetical protein